MALVQKSDSKNWYFTFKYKDPVTGNEKSKWINTGISCEKATQRAKNEAMRIGLEEKERFLEELALAQEEKKDLRISPKPHTRHSDDTVNEYAEYWLKEMRGSVEDSTLNSYEMPLRRHILPRIGEIKLCDLDQFVLKDFINSELDECVERQIAIDELKKKIGNDNLKVQPQKRPFYQSIRKHLRVISIMLNYAVSEGDIPENPVPKINPQVLKKIPESTFESHPYNKEEIARLREAIRGHHLESAIIIASYLGLRREEVLGLRWKDIDLENQRVYIRNVCRMVGSKVEYVEKTKTKASNTSLAIIAPLKNYLVELKQKQEIDRELYGEGYIETDIVCRWPDGRPIKPNNVSHGYARVLEKAGLRPTRFHDLRHTVGTIILEETGDLKLASAALRHADIGITANTYINPDEDFIRRGLETLDTEKKKK